MYPLIETANIVIIFESGYKVASRHHGRRLLCSYDHLQIRDVADCVELLFCVIVILQGYQLALGAAADK